MTVLSETQTGTLVKALIDIRAFHFNAREPFTYTSGKKGPVYVDIRRLISFPQARKTALDLAVTHLDDVLKRTDVIAGGETAGIPYAAFLAERTGKPMVYVRKKPKGFGRMAQIEGDLAEGARVLLVEDLANFGTSSEIFFDALQSAGAVVKDFFVIFDYKQAVTHAKMAEKKVRIHSLLDWPAVLAVARKESLFDAATLDSVEAFLHNPDTWKAVS